MKTDQFLRTRLLLGKEKFKLLQRARVTVVGLGAVGGCAAEALVRSGVGTLRLVDFAAVKHTNINRQLLAFHSTLGKQKTAVARERFADINPSCCVETLDLFTTEKSLDAILDNKPDIVIDAIDAMRPKVQLLTACHGRGIPVISSMGAALRTDPLSIRINDLFDSHTCPLANRLRKFLRKNGVGRGIQCVYSVQSPQADVQSPSDAGEIDAFVRGRQRNVLGSLITITAMFGFMVAHLAIERLTGGSVPAVKTP